MALIRGHNTGVLLWGHIIGVMRGVTYYSYWCIVFRGHITGKLFTGGGAYYRDIAGGWGIVKGAYYRGIFTGGHNTTAFAEFERQ